MNEETSIRISGDQSSLHAHYLSDALRQALALESKLPEWILKISGMSGRKYRRLINNLVGSVPNARYLEVGSWAGSTACSAMFGNKTKVTCIDNWSEFNGPKDAFFTATSAAKEGVDFSFIESDFLKVDYKAVGLYNIYLFDGPHTKELQHLGITIAQSALEKEYIQIVDDWNWPEVREGTIDGLKEVGAEILFSIEVRTTQDNTHPKKAIMEESEWHNGYLLAAIRKSRV